MVQHMWHLLGKYIRAHKKFENIWHMFDKEKILLILIK